MESCTVNGVCHIPPLAYKEVSVLTHTTQDILNKLAYEAHGQKVIEGLWEAPMPLAITPLRPSEAVDWDVRPMSFTYRKEKQKVKMINGQPISAKKSYRGRNKYHQFFGYKSEPPSAPLFIEDKPVGPAATAIKAAGELVAIAKDNNEDPEPIFELIEDVWKCDIRDIVSYIEPDLSNTSKKDLIKLTRKSIHNINGFNPAAPGVSVDMSTYRAETLNRSAYIDWHRISLGLRFIGEWNVKYNPAVVDLSLSYNYSPQFTPVLAEMPADRHIPLTLIKPVKHNTQVNPTLAKIVEQTMRYYKGTISNLATMNFIKSKGLVVSEIPKEDFDMRFARRLLEEDRPKVIRLPVSLADARVCDLEVYKDIKPAKSLISSKSKLEFEHHFSAKGAMKTLYEAYLTQIQGSNEYNRIRSSLTMFMNITSHGTITSDDFKKVVLTTLPQGFGDMLFHLLRLGTANDSEADDKFAEMIHRISPNSSNYELNSRSSLLIQAIKQSNNLDYIRNAIGGALRMLSDKNQSEKGIIFRPVPGGHPHDVIIKGLEDFAYRKLKYWKSHYDTRVTLYVDKLQGDPKSKLRNTWKLKVVIYSAIRQMYSIVKVRLSKGYWITLESNVSDWIPWTLKTIDNYRRKRIKKSTLKKYNAMLESGKIFEAEALNTWNLTDQELTGLRQSKTVKELFGKIDKLLNPKYKFSTLYSEINHRIKMSTGSIGVTFRSRISEMRGVRSINYDDVDEQDVLKVMASYDRSPINSVFLEPAVVREDDDFFYNEVEKNEDGTFYVDPYKMQLKDESEYKSFSDKNQFSILFDDDSEGESSDEEESKEELHATDQDLFNMFENIDSKPSIKDDPLMSLFGGDEATEDTMDFFMGAFEAADKAQRKADTVKDSIVNLSYMMETEYGIIKSNKEIGEILGLTAVQCQKFDLEWNYEQLTEIAQTLMSAELQGMVPQINVGNDDTPDIV